MDFYVVMDRAGYRVAKRRKCTQHVGPQHKVTKDDCIKWCAPKPQTLNPKGPLPMLLPPKLALLACVGWHKDGMWGSWRAGCD